MQGQADEQQQGQHGVDATGGATTADQEQGAARQQGEGGPKHNADQAQQQQEVALAQPQFTGAKPGGAAGGAGAAAAGAEGSAGAVPNPKTSEQAKEIADAAIELAEASSGVCAGSCL